MAGTSNLANEVGLDPLRCPNCGTRIRVLRSLELFFRAIIRRVRDGERVHIINFGTFSPRWLKERIIKTPMLPGGQARMKRTLTIRFKTSDKARDDLNPNNKRRTKR